MHLRVRSRAPGLLVAALVALAAKDAAAQDAPPPIEVPTTPVPQGPAPKAPPPPAKPAPKPAPAAPPAPKDGKAPAAAPAEKPEDGGSAEAPKPNYNNEGVFKVSGSKGPGWVGKGAKASAGTTTTGGAKPGKVIKATSAIVAEWPGFRITPDGGSEVMVEFSKPLGAPTEHKAAGTLTYVFKGAIVLKHNNQNPLLTVHFNTPVLSARLVPKKGELHLVIDLRPGVNAGGSIGSRAGAEAGGQQWFVTFPAGSYLPKDDDVPPPPKKTPKTTKSTPPPSTAPIKGGPKGPAQ